MRARSHFFAVALIRQFFDTGGKRRTAKNCQTQTSQQDFVVSTLEMQKTPLFDWHSSHGGRMVDFAGWSMPIQYSSIIDEHNATRKAIGIFDVSHMGRFFFSGDSIDAALDRLTTRRVAGIDVGRIRYSLMCNESGGILDDVLVYHLPKLDGSGSQFMMVVNASNREKIYNWIIKHCGDGSNFALQDRTFETAMIACQGPSANDLVTDICDIDPNQLKYYTGTSASVCGHPALVSRTGYTGEDGCEIIVDNEFAVEIWEEIHTRAQAVRGATCGLASRDTLRLEAAMPLYGHELGEDVNAAQTDLGFAMNFKDRDFIGRQTILSAKKDESLPKRIGIELEGKRAARQDCPILIDDNEVGMITSGTFSPTLQKSISMGYIQPQYAEVGTDLTIDIRGKLHVGKVVDLPFYKRD